MSGELRRRTATCSNDTAAGTSSKPLTSSSYADTANNMNYDETNLSARALLSSSPVHSSSVYKLHVPVLYALLPSYIRYMFTWRCCPSNWGPRWKRRRLIALGGYVYRFEDFDDDDGRGGGGGGGGRGGGGPPKGAPVPVTTVDARIIDLDIEDHDDDTMGPGGLGLVRTLPDGCRAMFEITSSGRTQRFAVDTLEDANIWVTSLRQMRQDAITRGMGHSAGVPYPPRWESFDMSARRLVDKKTRIKRRLEAMDKREIEMQIVGGGGMSTGYYS